MISDEIQQQLEKIGKDTADADRQLYIQRNKLMKPIYAKRREILKKVPNFWGTALGNNQMMVTLFEDVDQDLLNNITDFHVEHDDENPDSYTVSVSFAKNDDFENETLTKKITVNEDGETAQVEKATVNWKNGKKRKAGAEDEEVTSFIDWFANDDHIIGSFFRDDFFPDAINYFNGDDDSDDEEDLEEIELGSEDEEDEEEDEEEEEAPKPKKARK
ncbi:hypothetical protein BGW37DRAFT_506446 [Umbelopsis sp. PMI_123]|nr:hypothetical protein BGW37DRAFT_506446 [Umbelopsis sp. PMI_123]